MLVNGRRPLQARHELRFGTRELVIFCGAFLLVWGLTFVFGVLVGRELAPSGRDGAAARTASGGGSGRSPLAEPVKKTDRAGGPPAPGSPGADDRLTFYRTLTAPTPDLPAAEPPRIEEHIVPREAPGAPGKPSPRTPPRTARAPRPGAAAESPPAERSATTARRAEAVAAPAGVPEPLWTVQVSSFRSRALAEELRVRLAARGFDAYLLSVTTEEGRVRHRVRVGAFPTRGEAERVVSDLKAERNLNPFVTTRQR